MYINTYMYIHGAHSFGFGVLSFSLSFSFSFSLFSLSLSITLLHSLTHLYSLTRSILTYSTLLHPYLIPTTTTITTTQPAAASSTGQSATSQPTNQPTNSVTLLCGQPPPITRASCHGRKKKEKVTKSRIPEFYYQRFHR